MKKAYFYYVIKCYYFVKNVPPLKKSNVAIYEYSTSEIDYASLYNQIVDKYKKPEIYNIVLLKLERLDK